jgi:hypothetical protein
MPTDVICGLCRKHYDSDIQMSVCPHESIEKVERERKEEKEGKPDRRSA